MKGKQIAEIVAAIVSFAIKVIIVVWLVNFIYKKTTEAYDFGFRIFTETAVSPAPGRDVTVALTEGKTEKALASLLKEKGLVRDEKLALLQIYASEYKDTIEPGVYTLNTSMTLEEMMYAMSPSLQEEEAKEGDGK